MNIIPYLQSSKLQWKNLTYLVNQFQIPVLTLLYDYLLVYDRSENGTSIHKNAQSSPFLFPNSGFHIFCVHQFFTLLHKYLLVYDWAQKMGRRSIKTLTINWMLQPHHLSRKPSQTRQEKKWNNINLFLIPIFLLGILI